MTFIDTIIKEREKYALRGEDLMTIIDTNLIPYHELMKYNELEEILDSKFRCILLMESEYNNGHYVCLSYNIQSNILEFWDSYGNSHDNLIKGGLDYSVYKDGEYFLNRLIRKFMQKTKCEYIHSGHQFQRLSNESNVCGRYAFYRAQFHYIPVNEFNSDIVEFCKTHSLHPDDFVTMMTNLIHQ